MRHVKTTSTDPALLVGLDTPDDAAVYRVASDLAMVQTVDFFTPVVDDAFDWGRIAAANALSDVYAMGAKPTTALNLVGWPRSLGFELLGRVLEGAGAICEEAGVVVVGGHSVDDPEPKFGLAVTGFVHPERIIRKTGARPGDALILTKPLGMGIVSSAIKEGAASPELAKRATDVMAASNAAASAAMVAAGARAATDVTGFGLIGHLLQMLDGAVSARLQFSRIPVLAEAVDLASDGILPGGSKRNQEAHQSHVTADELEDAPRAVLFDAQTSGGLLIAIAPDAAADLVDAIRSEGAEEATVIGEITDGAGTVEVTR